MKKLLLLSLLLLVVLFSKAQGQVSVTFSTDFTETDLTLIVEDKSVSSLISLLDARGIFLVYEPSATFSVGIRVPLTRVGETLTYSSAPVTLEKNTLYEYYFEIGDDGYFAEGSIGDMALLAPGYYRFLYTNTTNDTWTLDACTFNGMSPAGKKLLRVKVDMSGTDVSSAGIFAVSGKTIVPLVNANKAVNSGDNQNIYEGILYGATGTDVTYTFYNGTVPSDRLIDNNTYTAQLKEDTENNTVSFSTTDLYEAVNFDLYDPDHIQRIEMKFAEENWAEILSGNKDQNLDVYLQSEWVKINGVSLPGAGVKFKGNSSYDASQTKNPFNISLDEFVSNKYQGYTSLKLANVYGDPSFVREVVSYEILNKYIESGKANFAQVYANGEYLGLYTNTEPVNKSFCSRHYGSKSNTFLDCSPVVSPTVATKSNLRYISANQADYEASYELKVGTWESFIALCDTVTNNPSALEKVMDIDKFIWLTAFNNMAVNLDSYIGVYSQNYYLYQSSEGRFMAIPWDFNLSFGGFNNIGNLNRLSTLTPEQRQQLALNVHSTDDYWPMLKNIYGNDRWKKMYLAHCKTIYEENFKNNAYLESAVQWQAQAERSVAADKNKFYSSLDAFYNSLTDNYAVNGYAVNGLKTFVDARKTYLAGLAEFTAVQPVLYNRSGNEGVFSVQADNANRVFFYYRQLGDGNGAFNAVEMTGTGGVYSTSLSDITTTLEYYFYAENDQIGAFLPARAAHEFYTYEVSNEEEDDLAAYWINEDFASHAVEADYITSVTARLSKPNNIELTSYYTNIEIQGGTCGSGNGLRIRGLGDNGYVEFTVPSVNSSIIAIKAKSSSADRSMNIYKNGELAETINNLDENNCYEYVDAVKSATPVTYKITGGKSGDTKPVIISSIIVEKYTNSGIDQSKATEIKVYPNPASDIVRISGCKSNDLIMVYNLTGSTIYKATAHGNECSIPVENWANGIYVLKCNNLTYKLIVKH